MSGRPARKIADWNDEPEKRIADRLAALTLMLKFIEAQLTPDVKKAIDEIMESPNPRADKYYWAHQLDNRRADERAEAEEREAL